MAGGFDRVDARDVALAAVQAASRVAAGSVYNLGGHWHALVELGWLAAGAGGVMAPAWTCPHWSAQVAAPFADLVAHFQDGGALFTTVSLDTLRSNHQIDIHKAVQELNYQLRPLQETGRDTVDWFKEPLPE